MFRKLCRWSNLAFANFPNLVLAIKMGQSLTEHQGSLHVGLKCYCSWNARNCHSGIPGEWADGGQQLDFKLLSDLSENFHSSPKPDFWSTSMRVFVKSVHAISVSTATNIQEIKFLTPFQEIDCHFLCSNRVKQQNTVSIYNRVYGFSRSIVR